MRMACACTMGLVALTCGEWKLKADPRSSFKSYWLFQIHFWISEYSGFWLTTQQICKSWLFLRSLPLPQTSNSSQQCYSGCFHQHEALEKCTFSSELFSPPPYVCCRPYSLTSGKKLWSHLGAEIEVAMLLRSTSYKPHQSLDSRNMLLHFGRPKHLSVLFWSWQINRFGFVLTWNKSIPNSSEQNDHPTAVSAWNCIISATSGGHCPWGTSLCSTTQTL